MKPITTTWNREELKTYMLIYCARADFNESITEEAFIKSNHPTGHFDLIHDEFKADNDFVSVEKIRSTVERLELSPNQIEALKTEIKELFKTDGETDIQEEIVLIGLSRLFGN